MSYRRTQGPRRSSSVRLWQEVRGVVCCRVCGWQPFPVASIAERGRTAPAHLPVRHTLGGLAAAGWVAMVAWIDIAIG